MIAQASKDENNKYIGGNAGNQTKQELNIRAWYNRPWNVVLRPIDKKVGLLIADQMEKACKNYNIGYDQGQRNTILTQAKKVDFQLDKIGVACECDCSSLVSVCCIGAGVKEAILYTNGNLCTTRNLRAHLISSGMFETLPDDPKYLNGDTYLKRGDILLYEGHHVAVNLTDGNKDIRYFPISNYTGFSLVDGLNRSGINSSKEYRIELAKANGIPNYKFSEEENMKLLRKLKSGQLIKP